MYIIDEQKRAVMLYLV